MTERHSMMQVSSLRQRAGTYPHLLDANPTELRTRPCGHWWQPLERGAMCSLRSLSALNAFVLESDVLAVNLTLRGICNEIRIA